MQQSTKSREFVPTAKCSAICQGKSRVGSALAHCWPCDCAFEGQKQQKCFANDDQLDDQLGYRQLTQSNPSSSARQYGNAFASSGDLGARRHLHPLQPKAVRSWPLQIQYSGHLKIQLQANSPGGQSATGEHIYSTKSWTKAKPGPTLVTLTIAYSWNRSSSYLHRANRSLDYQPNWRVIFKRCLDDLRSIVFGGIAKICLSV
jgi:hypothetical protein